MSTGAFVGCIHQRTLGALPAFALPEHVHDDRGSRARGPVFNMGPKNGAQKW